MVLVVPDQLREQIDQRGFALLENEEGDVIHTLGLGGKGRPELVALGLDRERWLDVVRAVAFCCRDNAQIESWTPIETPWPEKGMVFLQPIEDVLSHCPLLSIAASGGAKTVARIVVSDHAGRWPWDPMADPSAVQRQKEMAPFSACRATGVQH